VKTARRASSDWQADGWGGAGATAGASVAGRGRGSGTCTGGVRCAAASVVAVIIRTIVERMRITCHGSTTIAVFCGHPKALPQRPHANVKHERTLHGG
jgi:hypothetical protein